MRAVSLLPSATEIVAALGHGGDLVARSAECDHPPSVRSLPVAMRARTLDGHRPSAEIDARVRAARARGESLYELDVALLARTAPEVIFTQELCGVCSVTGEEVARACREAGIAPRVVSLMPRRLREVRSSVGTVAAALGDAPAGARLERALAAREIPASGAGGSSARIAVVEWVDPPILAGLWVPDLLAAAGAEGLAGLSPGPGEPGVRTTWEEIGQARPDSVVIAPCSFPVERSRAELGEPSVARGVGAVRGNVWVADEAYFSRPGPRLWDGLDLLRALVRGQRPPAPWPVAPWAPGPAEVAA